MGPDFRPPGFDKVPVQVQISRQRIDLSCGAERGPFRDTAFDGYVLYFVRRDAR